MKPLRASPSCPTPGAQLDRGPRGLVRGPGRPTPVLPRARAVSPAVTARGVFGQPRVRRRWRNSGSGSHSDGFLLSLSRYGHRGPPRPRRLPSPARYPRRSAEGRALKFEYPSKATMHLDVHPQMRELVGDHSVPLVITEGIVKADAGVSRLGVCVVGIAGVWCWRGANDDGGKTVLADWEHVALNDRDNYVVFDSDVMLKPSVHDALVRLGSLLQGRGAPGLHYAYLPVGESGEAHRARRLAGHAPRRAA